MISATLPAGILDYARRLWFTKLGNVAAARWLTVRLSGRCLSYANIPMAGASRPLSLVAGTEPWDPQLGVEVLSAAAPWLVTPSPTSTTSPATEDQRRRRLTPPCSPERSPTDRLNAAPDEVELVRPVQPFDPAAALHRLAVRRANFLAGLRRWRAHVIRSLVAACAYDLGTWSSNSLPPG